MVCQCWRIGYTSSWCQSVYLLNVFLIHFYPIGLSNSNINLPGREDQGPISPSSQLQDKNANNHTSPNSSNPAPVENGNQISNGNDTRGWDDTKHWVLRINHKWFSNYMFRSLGIKCETAQITHMLGFERYFPIQSSRFSSVLILIQFPISIRMSILLLWKKFSDR